MVPRKRGRFDDWLWLYWEDEPSLREALPEAKRILSEYADEGITHVKFRLKGQIIIVRKNYELEDVRQHLYCSYDISKSIREGRTTIEKAETRSSFDILGDATELNQAIRGGEVYAIDGDRNGET